jgi:hypothetical protein
MEKSALDRWAKGDPSGLLEIYAPEYYRVVSLKEASRFSSVDWPCIWEIQVNI